MENPNLGVLNSLGFREKVLDPDPEEFSEFSPRFPKIPKNPKNKKNRKKQNSRYLGFAYKDSEEIKSLSHLWW